MVTLEVRKTQGLTHALEKTFFEKPQGGDKLTPPVFLDLKRRDLNKRFS